MRKDLVEASKALTDARNFLSFKNPNTFTDNKECSHQGTLSVDRMIKDSVLTITNLLLIINDKDKDYARSVDHQSGMHDKDPKQGQAIKHVGLISK